MKHQQPTTNNNYNSRHSITINIKALWISHINTIVIQFSLSLFLLSLSLSLSSFIFLVLDCQFCFPAIEIKNNLKNVTNDLKPFQSLKSAQIKLGTRSSIE